MFENIKIKSDNWILLDADFYKVNWDKIVIMSHWFRWNKISLKRFEKIAKALNKNWYSALSFDFSWCWKSWDSIITLENEIIDLKSVINYVKKSWYEEIVLYGHSLWSYVSLLCYNSNISKIIWSWACTWKMDYNWLDYFSQEQLDFLEKNDYLISEDYNWNKIKLSKEIISCFSKINQKELCEKVKCRVLLINWNSETDKEELELLKNSKKAMKYLPSWSELKIIEWANHWFLKHLDELIWNILDFLKK